MNTINIINTYRLKENPHVWVFDDDRFGLHREPFVCGASEFISSVVGPHCSRATLTFSITPFPGGNAVLIRTWKGDNTDIAGSEYLAKHIGREDSVSVWLCPAMCYYFGGKPATLVEGALYERTPFTAPEAIFAQIAPAEDTSASCSHRVP